METKVFVERKKIKIARSIFAVLVMIIIINYYIETVLSTVFSTAGVLTSIALSALFLFILNRDQKKF